MRVLERNACPSCGKAITLRQLLLGAEKFAIRCKHCDARLWKRTRAMLLVFPLLVVLWQTERELGMFSWAYAAAVVSTFVLTAIVAWFTVRVQLAPDDMPDRPSLKPPKLETRDSPPPMAPFRGSSGPPDQGV